MTWRFVPMAFGALVLVIISLQVSVIDFQNELAPYIENQETPGQSISSASREYCMMWCPGRDERSSLPGSVPLGLEHQMQVHCCKVCTLNRCFQIISDTRKPTNATDITIGTFATFDRLGAMDLLNKNWIGPKTLIIFLSDYNHQDRISLESKLSWIHNKTKEWSNTLVAIYLTDFESDSQFFADTNIIRSFKSNSTIVPLLPINTLRNIAMDLAETQYFFGVDIDFYPSRTCYARVQSILSQENNLEEKSALIIPHFEFRSCFYANSSIDSLKSFYPETIEEFMHHFNLGRIRPFESCFASCYDFGLNFSLFSPQACQNRIEKTFDRLDLGRLTGYEAWVSETRRWIDSGDQTQIVSRIQRRLSSSWEPYLIASIPQLTRYNEMFVGRYFDKVSFVTSQTAKNMSYHRVTGEFLFHQAHPQSLESMSLHLKFRSHQERMRRLFHAVSGRH